MLNDSHGRTINYLRLAVTDKCNLRCFYCMPQEGMQWLQRDELMSDDEILKLCNLLVKMGIEKIRITGGEPFVRKNILQLLTSISKIKGLHELTITTNGVRTAPYVAALKKINIHSVNLSLDTLSRDNFFKITRRDELPNVLKTLDELLHHDIKVKINAVVMDGKNTDDIIPLAALTQHLPLQVRFIEEMPFNGTGHSFSGLNWNYQKITALIQEKFPGIKKIANSPTSINYQVPGYAGSIGIIAAFTRSFCGACNRIRITPQGLVKTCLYGKGELNIKDLLRAGETDEALKVSLTQAIRRKAKDGHEAELNQHSASALFESMAMIGG